MSSLTGRKFSSIKHNDMSFDARVEATPEVAQEETPQVLTISSLIAHIKEDGMSRDEIRKKYGLTIAEAKEISLPPQAQGYPCEAAESDAHSADRRHRPTADDIAAGYRRGDQ